MPFPSYTETLGTTETTLGPGITVINGGNFFSNEDDTPTPDINTMNKEMGMLSKKDGIVFMESEPPKEDLLLKSFLESRK